MSGQQYLFANFDEDLESRIRSALLDLLSTHRQPSAWEILELVEHRFGFTARWRIKNVLEMLSTSRKLSEWQRSHVVTLLNSSDLPRTISDKEIPENQVERTIDRLLQEGRAYRNSESFQEMISFVAKFRRYAPYNNLLVRIQNPGCSFYATRNDWAKCFGREIKEDARPMLILMPMHPVMTVYDLDQTEGPPLPERLQKFGQFEGCWNPDLLRRTLKNAAVHYHILVQLKSLSATHGGFATGASGSSNWKTRIVVHDGLDESSRFGVLCHELAHVLCGHLGCDADHWWPNRRDLSRNAVEIEAEAVAYIVSARFGLRGPSASYTYPTTWKRGSRHLPFPWRLSPRSPEKSNAWPPRHCPAEGQN